MFWILYREREGVFYVCCSSGNLASGICKAFLHFGSQGCEALHECVNAPATLLARRDPFAQSSHQGHFHLWLAWQLPKTFQDKTQGHKAGQGWLAVRVRRPKRSKKNINRLDLQRSKLDQVTESINLYVDFFQLFFKAFLPTAWRFGPWAPESR